MFSPTGFFSAFSKSSNLKSIGSFPVASASSSKKDCSAPAIKLDLGALKAPTVMFEGSSQLSAL